MRCVRKEYLIENIEKNQRAEERNGIKKIKKVLTGEIERSPTGRVDPVRGCLNNPSRLG
jgi:hypothetical protein